MRKYEDYQDTDSVLIDGEKATKLKTVVKEFESKASDICTTLTKAFEEAGKQFSQLTQEYQPQYQQILEGTRLAKTDPSQVVFDLKNLEQYGIAFAKQKERHPFMELLETLNGAINNGTIQQVETDHIIVEPVSNRSWSERV